MAGPDEWMQNLAVLRNKRDATRYLILVQIAERQPAVSQSEIAESLGITPQAVSEYLNGLVEEAHVEKLGRGRWEITPTGVDWLISQTEALGEFTDHVWDAVIEQGGVETAIATGSIDDGQQVTLEMNDGVLQAHPDESGPATARALTAAEDGQDVAVTDITGLLEFSLGTVTMIEVPPAQEGGSAAIDETVISERVGGHDILAVAGPEALAAVRQAGVAVDMQYGTEDGVQEAALKGMDVLLVVVATEISKHADRLREFDISYEVIEAHR